MNKLGISEFDNVSKQTIAYYDSEAKVYDAKRYGSKRGQKAELFHKKILDLMFNSELDSSARVLDLGCGTGRLLPHMASKGYELCGLDLSEGMLELARQRLSRQEYAKKIRLELGAITAMPFEYGYFDAVYSILVINLIRDYTRVFQEVARVLKSGGIFVFNVPNLASLYFPGGIYVNLRGRTVTSNVAGHRYSHWFMPRECKTELKNVGFAVEDVKGQPLYLRLSDNCNPINPSGLGMFLSVSLYIKARLRCR